MKHLVALGFITFLYSVTFGQTITDLYNNKKFEELITYKKKRKLSPVELYMIGSAFFHLKNDEKAIEFFDAAIAEGLDTDYVHYDKAASLSFLNQFEEAVKEFDLAISKGRDYAYIHYEKALALRGAKRFDEAIQEFDIAIKKDPINQDYLSEKGLTYYHSGQIDKALAIFSAAQKLTNTNQAPFYMVPHIYHSRGEYDKALKGFYEALNHITKNNEYYLLTLQDIGRLEYTVTKDFAKSVEAYKKAIALSPKEYSMYGKLIKAYNAGKMYSKADSVFGLLKKAFERNELGEEDMEAQNIPIDEDEWNGRKLLVYKYLVDPQNSLDISYKVYLLNKEGNKIERVFMVEQTIPLTDTPKHLLCEQDKKTGSHITYPYGWKGDAIPLDNLKKAVILVLEGKMRQGASSNFID